MAKPTLDSLASTLFVAPSLGQRGVGVDEVVFALGLVCERFYDSVWGAEPAAIAEAAKTAASLRRSIAPR